MTKNELLQQIATLEALVAQLQGSKISPKSPPPVPSAVPPPPVAPMSPPPTLSAASSDGISVWLIIGPVLGGVVLIAALLVLLWWRIRYRGETARPLIFWRTQKHSSPNFEHATQAIVSADEAQEVQVLPDPFETSENMIDESRQRLLVQIASLGRCQADDDSASANAEKNVAHAEVSVESLEASVRSVGTPDAALLAAVTQGAGTRTVQELLQRGANPDASFLERTVLMVAVRLCPPGVTQQLIAAGATVDRKDARGWTPLMHAIDAHTPLNCREAVVIQLLDAGAAVDVWNDDLKGPFDLLAAKKHGDQQQYGALGTMEPQASGRHLLNILPSARHASSGATSPARGPKCGLESGDSSPNQNCASPNPPHVCAFRLSDSLVGAPTVLKVEHDIKAEREPESLLQASGSLVHVVAKWRLMSSTSMPLPNPHAVWDSPKASDQLVKRESEDSSRVSAPLLV
eukprot:CAMPEP_0119301146 /NCGR_PEP_ID=MMETSP1333-20130426/2973_1 /TAXON_ID=418940 /ORGANISM="Scyphosphaera apsteinii, Strain RCC1455" /LENGTH=460 /DNA_ID=CAMNT_0007303143 /DNA_START=71 /DNA_END=1454 /DNA_ORIENTATION=-